MTTPDGGPAFPATCSANGTPLRVSYPDVSGMSLRAYIATAALQGITASDVNNQLPPEKIALWAVQCADAIIAELNKPTK